MAVANPQVLRPAPGANGHWKSALDDEIHAVLERNGSEIERFTTGRGPDVDQSRLLHGTAARIHPAQSHAKLSLWRSATRPQRAERLVEEQLESRRKPLEIRSDNDGHTYIISIYIYIL